MAKNIGESAKVEGIGIKAQQFIEEARLDHYRAALLLKEPYNRQKKAFPDWEIELKKIMESEA